MSKPNLQAITRELFSTPQTQAFALLDGASVPGLLEALAQHAVTPVCLQRGSPAPDLAAVLPYLVEVPQESALLAWLVAEVWGRHGVLFVVSAADRRTLCRHFRSLLLVKTPAGKQVFFRFYDPRVLRVYLPTCTPAEEGTVYGPVLRYALEAEDPGTLLVFTAGRPAPRSVALPTVRSDA